MDEQPQQERPHPAPNHPPQQQRLVPLNRLDIRALNNPHASLQFGRMDSDYRVVDFTAQIENQNTLSAATYQAISAVTSINLDITQEQFVQMWKTILLKRVQDVYEAAKFSRPAGFVRLGRQIPIPGPLADLLHSIGHFHSNATGHNYHVIPPPAPVAPEPWRAVNNDLLALWNREMHRVSPLYTMKEFPAMNQCGERPLVLTTRQLANDVGIIKAWTNEPKQTDAFVRLANDDLFQEHPFINFANCSLTMTGAIFTPGFVNDYAGSYILNVNA